MKNLLPVYHIHLFANHFPNFKALVGAKIQIEDAITFGQTRKEENKFKRAKNFRAVKTSAEVSNIIPQQPLRLEREKMNFIELNMPLSKVHERCKASGFLQLLILRPLPNPLPGNRNPYK